MIIVLLGAPGAGKGTQAELLSAWLGIPHISSGDLFRSAIQSGSELGLRAQTYINAGELVPDEVTIAMVAERLRTPECAEGVILDGFPRTQNQALALKAFLDTLYRSVDTVLSIIVSNEVLMERLTGRWICPQCGTVYHAVYKPEKVKGLCDIEGARLYQRSDDAPATQGRRIEVYLSQTAPLIEFYRSEGVLAEVDGEGSVEEVQQRLREVISAVRAGSGR
ncbi:MAG: adenylate kinase [Chloroflexi bacterium]|nr:adenylate kinase [Chloroflexota bacterium]